MCFRNQMIPFPIYSKIHPFLEMEPILTSNFETRPTIIFHFLPSPPCFEVFVALPPSIVLSKHWENSRALVQCRRIDSTPPMHSGYWSRMQPLNTYVIRSFSTMSETRNASSEKGKKTEETKKYRELDMNDAAERKA